ncbi:MAG: UDP-glucose 4-epimerase GalE, partial [Bryobacteraceae bacterium]
MPILVTGGAGYIGSHCAKMAARHGIEPIVLDNLTTGHQWAVRWGPLVEGDVGDASLVRRTLREHKIDAVIHFAANCYVGESVVDPRKYFHNNVVNTLALLDAVVEAGITSVVFSSSCATYGIPDKIPITEQTRQCPVNPYGESKLFVERMLHWYGVAYHLRSVALRYFNAAGADPDGELGERHDPETHLIPLVLDAALGRKPFVSVYGADYPTADGTAIRDYVHVTDLADAHLRALEYLQAGGPSLALNLGSETGYSIKEVVSAAERIAGAPFPVRFEGRRPGDPPVLIADCRKAREVLGWRPQFSGLDTIL